MEIKDNENVKSIDSMVKDIKDIVGIRSIKFTPEPLFVFAVILTFALVAFVIVSIFIKL